MGLESLTGGAVYINSLVNTNPVKATDYVADGSLHIQGIKNVILNTFPNITGAVTSTHTELNILDGATATTAEINYLDLTTGAGTAEASKALVLDGSKGIATITSATITTLTTTTINLGGAAITSTAAEINYLDLTTGAGTAEASKAVVLDASKNIATINSLTATTITGTTINQGANNVVDDADIGITVQAYDADLAAIAALANTDGNFIVGNGAAWVAESGATARTSLGIDGASGVLATGDYAADSVTLLKVDSGTTMAGLLGSQYFVYETVLTHSGDTTWTTVETLKLYIPSDATTIHYQVYVKTSSSPTTTAAGRLTCASATGTATGTTNNTYTWTGAQTLDVSAESGWTDINIQIYISVASAVTVSLSDVSLYIA